MPPSSSILESAPVYLSAWLLTFLVHSTVLLCGVWLVTRWGWVRSHAWKETLWKAALVGGLVTATAQTGFALGPVLGRVSLPESRTAVPALVPAPDSPTAAVVAADDPDPARAAHPVPEQPGLPGPAETGAWPSVLAAGWSLAALWGMLRFARLKRGLRRALRGRVPVEDERVLGLMDALRRGSGFRPRVLLSTLGPLGGPIAFGRREICIPKRVLTHLTPEQQRSALAHEMAHLVRRDPAWLTWGGILEHVFFFQPLIRVARRELREIAEFQCDDWAVQHTGGGVSLARCLAEVASWRAAESPALAAGMAESGSPLVRRIQRLLDDRPASRTVSPGRTHLAGAAGLLLITAWAAPGIATRPVISGDDLRVHPWIGVERDRRDAPRGGTGVASALPSVEPEILWLVSPEEAAVHRPEPVPPGRALPRAAASPAVGALPRAAASPEPRIRVLRSPRRVRILEPAPTMRFHPGAVGDPDGIAGRHPFGDVVVVEGLPGARFTLRVEERRSGAQMRTIERTVERIALLEKLGTTLEDRHLELAPLERRALERVIERLVRDLELLILDVDLDI